MSRIVTASQRLLPLFHDKAETLDTHWGYAKSRKISLIREAQREVRVGRAAVGDIAVVAVIADFWAVW
jgi:hypothetical protein